VGQTRVDLQHLLEDLRDAYTGALEETILTEIAANALDSGATRIQLRTDPADATLIVVDDGRGMQRRDMARYHDVAASTKARGDGIGFAGVGIKLGLLVASEVVTETRRGPTHIATRWHLASRYRAPWTWIPAPGLTAGRGTAVQLRLRNPLSPLLDAGYLEEAIRRHFEPLFEATFDQLLRRHYGGTVQFEVDGHPLPPVSGLGRHQTTIPIRMGRRRLPSAIALLARHDRVLPDDRQGIAISTFGKVIKRGWDWLGLTPATPGRVNGVIEAPELAACLTLSKNDFIRTGPRGATYLAYRRAMQEVVARQLTEWGDTRDPEVHPRTVRLERDLERVLEHLAEEFPLLRSLVDHRAGGQKRLPLPGRGPEQVPGPLFADLPSGQGDDVEEANGTESDPPGVGGPRSHAGHPSEPQTTPREGDPDEAAPATPPPGEAGGDDAQRPAPVGTLATVAGRRRPARYGLLLKFESRPGDNELGRLVDSTIWINEAHPAYRRAAASRSAGYHLAVTVAFSLAPLAVDAADEHAFVTQFLAHWGGADGPKPPRKGRRARASRPKEVSSHS
jgi:hypothetical protein